MKKIIIPVILLLIVGCSNKEVVKVNSNNKEIRGIFFSYIDLNNYIKSNSVDESKKKIDQVIKNVEDINFNLIILQVRSFSDAIYKSNIYPWSSTISGEEGKEFFDVLDYFLKEAHKKNILIYAWINPYRVRSTEDTSSISIKNPASKYIGTDTLYVGGGIYYNPSKQEVLDLIVKGVEEVINNYKVDGIIFDDYFYPNNEIDKADYEKYIKTKEKISIEEYHLKVINKMIREVHKVCSRKKIIFGVSPDGNIENNYNKNFADVKKWLSTKGYVDFIMPQIYYGFLNEEKPFLKVVEQWSNLIKRENIDLIVALAFYKVGKIDEFAKTGKMEWIENNDIIKREIIISRNVKHYKGFSLFRYGNLFDTKLFTDTNILEKENMCKVLN